MSRTLPRAAAVLVSAALAMSATASVPGTASADTGLGYDAVNDKGSLYNIAEVVGAHAAWRSGYTGKGVGVALIDTGVSPVAGLTSGNVVDGPDLSLDSQSPAMAHLDAFGPGTHLASIIAGRDASGSPSSYLDATRFNGIAPDGPWSTSKWAPATAPTTSARSSPASTGWSSTRTTPA